MTETTCNHPQPELCRLLGRHILGTLWSHWNNRRDYRQLWCNRAGVDLDKAEALFPPAGKRTGQGSLECAHRGEQIDTATCKTCAGNVRLKVFDCAVHGRCVLEKNVQGVQQCKGCVDQEKFVPAEIEHLIASFAGPKKDRPRRWQYSPNVEEAYRVIMDRYIASIPEYPGGFEGRGIITCAGGAMYFTCVYVMLSILREQGCTLPVEVWYLGWEEMDEYMVSLLEALGGVACINAHEVEASLPEDQRPRSLGGWESKAFAIRHSRFREVLFVDADQVTIRDPSYLFDTLEYQQTGTILWPDLINQWGLDIEAQAFRTARLRVPSGSHPKTGRPTEYRPAETGQLLIDKQRAWRPLLLCSHICDHSDYWWSGPNWLVYGDKSAFYLAWERAGEYYMPANCRWVGDRRGGAFLQQDPSGEVLFQHRCQPVTKYNLHGENIHPRGFRHSDRIDHYLQELRHRWVGQPYDLRHADVWNIDEVAGRYCLFRGRELSEEIILEGDGRVVGFGRSDLHWSVEDGHLMFSTWKKGEFRFGPNTGTGYGWCNHQDDIFLLQCPPDRWRWRHCPGDLIVWGDVGIRDDYKIPEKFPPGSAVVDVGAHAGFFTALCLERGADEVIAFEPDPDNFKYLRENTASYQGHVNLHQAAAWSQDTELQFGRPPASWHTGGGSVVDSTRIEAHSVTALDFDRVIRETLRGRRIALLKLDCEGAEFPILMNSQELSRCDRIAGEIHEGAVEGTEWDLEGLLAKLRKEFSVEVNRIDEGLWIFNAVKLLAPI